MRARLLVGAGFAAGYLLGARAGRARYEAILATVRRLRDDPSLQGTAGLLQAQVAGAAGSVRRAVGAGPVGGGDPRRGQRPGDGIGNGSANRR